MATQLANQLKYANLQLAAEAFFIGKDQAPNKTRGLAGDIVRTGIDPLELQTGNTRSSRFTTEAATEFSLDWEIVEHIANTTTGFSGKLRVRSPISHLLLDFVSTIRWLFAIADGGNRLTMASASSATTAIIFRVIQMKRIRHQLHKA